MRRHSRSRTMKNKTMEDLFYTLLQDVYHAEKQLVRALPKVAKNTANSELQEAFTNHLEETKGHVDRLEQAFEMIDKKAKAKKCDAMLGLVAEANEVIEECEDDNV